MFGFENGNFSIRVTSPSCKIVRVSSGSLSPRFFIPPHKVPLLQTYRCISKYPGLPQPLPDGTTLYLLLSTQPPFRDLLETDCELLQGGSPPPPCFTVTSVLSFSDGVFWCPEQLFTENHKTFRPRPASEIRQRSTPFFPHRLKFCHESSYK